MLDTDVNSLGDDSVADLLVDDNSNGARVDVEDGSSATVVVLVGHTLVDGAIDCNVNNVADLVGSERLGNVDSSVLLEALSELVSGSALVAVAVSHAMVKK